MAVVRPATENTVEQRPVSRQSLQAAEFSGGRLIAQGAADLGRSIAGFAEQQHNLNVRYAETAARRARTEALRRVGEVRSRVEQTQLLEAEPARQRAEQELQQIRREMGEGLQDPLARRMFDDSFDSAVSNDLLRMREHADRQIRTAENAEAEAAIDLSTQRMVDMRGSPEAVAAERGVIEANVRRRLQGAPQQVIDLALQRAYSGAHRATALAILSSDEPGAGAVAMEYLRTHAGEITPEHELSLFQVIQPQYDNDVIEGGFGEVAALVESGQVSTEPVATDEQPEAQPREISGRDYSPVGEAGTITATPEQHVRRGRVAIDYAAPPGTPIRPPTSGVVAEAPREQQGANGYMVRVRHPNGYVSTYLHMQAPSPLNVGDEVTRGTIIGAVGSTGHSTGPHVDFSVRDENNNVLNPNEITWTGEDLPLHTPQRHDLAAWYRAAHRIASERGYNSRQYGQLLERIDRHAARQERLVDRAQQEVDRQVMLRIAELDENLTDISQVPNFGAASPSLQISIRNMIDQNTRATEPEANGTTFLDAEDLAYGTPEQQQQFLNLNVRELPITRGEQRSLQRRQNEIRDEVRESISDSRTAASLSRVDTAIRRTIGNPQTRPGGFTGADVNTDTERMRFGQLRDAVARRVQAEQRRLGRDLTDTELEGAVRAETLTVTVREPGVLWGTRSRQVPAYQLPEIRERLGDRIIGQTIEIPVADRDRILDELSRRGNHNPSEGEIAFWYRRSLIYRQ